MVTCTEIEAKTVRELIAELEKFVAAHGDMPLLYDSDSLLADSCWVCTYDEEEDRFIKDGEKPYPRAHLSI